MPETSDVPARFHREYRPALMAFFLRRVQDHAEAEDLTQEVFIRIAVAQRAPLQSADAYIFQTAANLLRDRVRRDTVRRSHADGARAAHGFGVETLDPWRVAAGREALAQLVAALDELPERTRQIFVLFRFEHVETGAIADAFGISQRAVQAHIAKAMGKLANAMRDRR